MLAILQSLGMCIIVLFKSRRRLEAENLFLRHQLSIALRRAPPRLRLRGSDRALLVWMTRLWPSLLGAAQVLQRRRRVPGAVGHWKRSSGSWQRVTAPRRVSATARRNGLSASQLFTWRRLAREGRTSRAPHADVGVVRKMFPAGFAPGRRGGTAHSRSLCFLSSFTVLACGPFSPISSAKMTCVPTASRLNAPWSTLLR